MSCGIRGKRPRQTPAGSEAVKCFFQNIFGPCSGCLLLKRYRHVLAVKERRGGGEIIAAAVTEIPCRLKRKMKVGTLRETRSPWDKHSRKQGDALYSVQLLAKMSAVSPTERDRARNTYLHRSPVLEPC